MKLTRLEIYGFKSFPQRTDILFDDGITGIVGPNGSGKSNIADAVRWVLGEQSAKALRGARMEDVIFAGTQKRRLMPYCEVSLVFDNTDKALKSDHTEVMVTRRVYRTGEGEYSLNKKNCRLKDIVELFHDTGVGREGYSIIGQGHIDIILSGRGEERRAAFEEAAGIMGFRARKEEAQRKLARTQDNLSRVGDLLEELQNRLDPLKEQSEQAREYLALSGRLKHLDANIYIARHQRLSKRMDSLKQNLTAIAEQIEETQQAIAKYQQQRRQAEEQLEAADTLNDTAQNNLNQREADLREHLILSERTNQQVLSLQDEAAKTEQIQQSLQLEIEEMQQLQASAGRDKSQSDQMLQKADQALLSKEEEAASAQAALDQAQSDLDSHRSQLLAAANSRSDARERKARQQTMLAQAESRLQEMEDARPRLEEELKHTRAQLDQANERLSVTVQAVEEQRNHLNKQEQLLQTARQELKSVQANAAQANIKAQQDKARLDALEELSKGHEGYYQPVRMAMQHAKGNANVHGVVAQLMRVPKELEVAVENVLGGSLQHIVTQDEETAKELIDFLRERRLGRATFLPLSAVRGRSLSAQERDALKLPGCLGLASELVEFEPQYQGVIQSLLGRTVVTEDLQSAIVVSRHARQAFNVVTLLGDVMRAGGAMTGGSIQKQTVSLLGREREAQELADNLQIQMKNILLLDKSAKQKQQAADDLEQQLSNLRAQVQDEEIGIAREEEQVARAKERYGTAQSVIEQHQAAREQLQEILQDLSRDLAQADEQTQLVEQDQEQMLQLEEVLRARQAKAYAANEAAREALVQAQAYRQQLAHSVDLITRDQARFTRELDALRLKQQRQGQAREALLERLYKESIAKEKMQNQAAVLQKSAEEARAAFQQTEQHRRSLASSQRGLTEQSEAAHQRLNEESQRKYKAEMSLQRLEEELQFMTSTLWNTHELTYALAEEFLEERFDLPAGEKEAETIRKSIREMGPINIHALEEYAATKSRYDELSIQREDAIKASDDLETLIKRLQGQMEKQFVREFTILNDYFREAFSRLFNGGQASLSLADPSQPLDCEIVIKAQPPGKKLQLLSLLSGGERALTAIAILFAMLKLKPTPFCILDEIEAALDDANINNFADYLAEYAKDTQFIVITHRKGTMERCDALYGVTMREKGVSDIISVNLKEYTA